MTNAFGRYDAPDGVDVPMRQPAGCPYCGHDGAFDGQGSYGDGYLHYCPTCGLQFVTFLPEVDV
jgi:hypothetical protein